MARKSGFDFRKFDKFRGQIRAGSNGPLRGVFKQWGVRYLGWTRRLFLVKSHGGSADGVTWPKLKPATVRSRRAGTTATRRTRTGLKRGPRRYSILRDTGTTFKALTINAPGNLFNYLKDGVRVGFGGPSKHPEGKATIRDIAVFHDKGEGRLPKRQILHKPNNEIKVFMRNTLRAKIGQIGRGL